MKSRSQTPPWSRRPTDWLMFAIFGLSFVLLGALVRQELRRLRKAVSLRIRRSRRFILLASGTDFSAARVISSAVSRLSAHLASGSVPSLSSPALAQPLLQETLSAPELVTRVVMWAAFEGEQRLGIGVRYSELAEWSGWCGDALQDV